MPAIIIYGLEFLMPAYCFLCVQEIKAFCLLTGNIAAFVSLRNFFKAVVGESKWGGKARPSAL